ncbi:ketopantoate reductase family protein [Marinibaculum pumilum]|uniref:2-dehydropantoate 2-reductase n=1 Tax=Marinibaculum pumilum TaxID=1766165 RepID=A0ABV7L2Q0_9PROT
MRLAVYGVGAIGGLVAARLVAAGHDVTGICRGATLQAIRSDGLHLTVGKDRTRHDLKVTDDPTEAGPQDMILACVKANALPGVIDGLKALSGPDTLLVPLVNGVPFWFFQGFGGPLADTPLQSVDPGGALAAAFPAERVTGAVVHISCSVPQPGHVHNHGGNRLIIGPPTPAVQPQADRVADLLEGAGFGVERTPRIREAVWEKLAGNLNFNPISALTRATVDRIAGDPESKAICVATMREIMTLADSLGLAFELDPDARVALALKLGPFRTSMLQDVDAGRRLELEPIVGAVVEIADRLQVPVPSTRAIYGLARLLDESLAAA